MTQQPPPDQGNPGEAPGQQPTQPPQQQQQPYGYAPPVYIPPGAGTQQPQAPQQFSQPQYVPPPHFAYVQPTPGGPFPHPGPGEPFDGARDPRDVSRPLYGASFPQAFARFFRSYVRFTGRSSRSEYWWSMLFVWIAQFIPMLLLIIGMNLVLNNSGGTYKSSAFDPSYGGGVITPENAANASLGSALSSTAWILLVVVGLGLLLPNIAIIWRRFHDANFPGPFYFLGCIPYVGPLIVLVFMFLGPNPSGRRFDR